MSDDVRFQSLTVGSPLLGLIPAIMLIALALFARRHATKADLGWLFPILTLTAAVTIWNFIGLSAGGLFALLVFCACGVGASALIFRRHELNVDVKRLLALIIVAATLTLELACNNKFFTIGPQFWLIELALIGAILLFLWFVSLRRVWPLLLFVFVLYTVGFAQHYVVQFRGTSILPSDILAFHTALSVSGGYTYILAPSLLYGAGAMELAVALAAILHATKEARTRQLPRDIARAAVAAVAAVALVVPSYADVFGANIDYWWSKDWYERQGFIPSFIYAWQDLKVSVPAGYGTSAATEAEQRLIEHYGGGNDRTQAQAQFEELTPNIIVIQNETFCDLSVFGDLGCGYEGPTFFKGMDEGVLTRGDLAVSVFGGGTCNTEFEFLTGSSLAFLGTAKYPFAMYDLDPLPSLAKDLKLMGYESIGIHPNIASNWNRDRAYGELGIDEFLTIDDFEGADQFHTHVSDWATYERVLDLIDRYAGPLFVFDVTMQNHSGYDTKSIDESLLGAYTVEGTSEDDDAQLREFIACIDESDRAFARLITALKEVEEPTVVCMYGDHHPWLAEAINDLTHPNEDPLDHAERIHNTSYVIWANYDVAGRDQTGAVSDDTSADMLAALLLDTVGAPLDTYDMAQLGARDVVRAINASGWRDADGAWHALSEQPDLLHDLALVEYRVFGSKVQRIGA